MIRMSSTCYQSPKFSKLKDTLFSRQTARKVWATLSLWPQYSTAQRSASCLLTYLSTCMCLCMCVRCYVFSKECFEWQVSTEFNKFSWETHVQSTTPIDVRATLRDNALCRLFRSFTRNYRHYLSKHCWRRDHNDDKATCLLGPGAK